jgi:hypothetical protein
MAENTSDKKSSIIIYLLIGAVVIIGLILAFVLPRANAAVPTTAPTAVEPTSEPPTATATYTSEPTQTALPPTATATATSLPSPTPIPALALKDNGFSSGAIRMTKLPRLLLAKVFPSLRLELTNPLLLMVSPKYPSRTTPVIMCSNSTRKLLKA